MKKILNFLALTFTIIVFSTCAADNGPENDNQVAIYWLKDKTVTWSKFQEIKNKDSLEFEKIISSEMIDAYDFSSHIIYLNTRYPDFLIQKPNAVLVMMAGSQKCYYFTNQPIGYSSDYCSIRQMFPYESNIALLNFLEKYYKDIRDDERVKRSLMETGKYRAGINVVFDDIKSVFINDSMYFELKVTLTNLDSKSIYIMDPSDGWIGYTYGGCSSIQFWKMETFKNEFVYISMEKDIKNEHNIFHLQEAFKPADLIYLKGGESVSRTFIVSKADKQYAHNVQEGNMRCAFHYTGPLEVTQQQISLPGGRVWVGTKYTNVMDVTLSKTGLVINNKNVVLE